MESPTVYVIHATPSTAQDVLKSTRDLARRPNSRVIVIVSYPPRGRRSLFGLREMLDHLVGRFSISALSPAFEIR
jgi:hypothetical protein